MILPDLDEAQLQAVFDNPAPYYLNADDVEALGEFLSLPPGMRENGGRQDHETLLRIQLSTFALYQQQTEGAKASCDTRMVRSSDEPGNYACS